MRFLADALGGKSITGRLIIAGIVFGLIIISLLIGAYRTVEDLIEKENESNQLVLALRNHVEADMMHDAMRSTVLSALQAGLTQDEEQAQSARAELVEYAAWLGRLHDQIEALDLPEDVRADFGRVEAEFVEYSEMVENIVAVAPENPEAGMALKAAFDAKFQKMEVSNELVSDDLEARVSDATTALKEEMNQAILLIEIGAGIMLLITIANIFYFRSILVQPIIRIARDLESDEATDLAGEEARKDEIGHLARSVTAFREAAERVRLSEEARAEALRDAEEQTERKRALAATAEALEARTVGVVEQVTQTAAQLKTIADALAQSASRSRQETTAAAAAAEQTVNGVVAIAQATDELIVSIDEVANRIHVVAQSGEEARNLAHSTESTIAELNAMTKQVGSFTVLIGEIAQRSNLLALNATIEAAHAGAAGSGFAVVADEVKQLSQQTAKAVEEIEAQIAAMTGITENAVSSLANMAQAINELGGATTSIASAAEQQSLATKEIGQTIEMSSTGTESMRGNLHSVEAQVGDTAMSAEEVREATVRLDQQAAELNREIADFIARAKAA